MHLTSRISILFLLCSAAGAFAADRKPNIVVIVGDDMGYADVGAHGCKDIPTPHIDSIARSGVRCSSGYVTGPYCSPTRAALLTGRYQQRFGHEFNPGPPTTPGAEVGLPLGETTMPQRLKEAGYATGMVGKWHLGNGEKFHPMSRGFDEFYGFLGGAHTYFVDKPPPKNNPILRGREPVQEKEYLTDAFGRDAVAYVERHKAEPFFLYLAFNAVHTPMEAPPKYLDRVGAIAPEKARIYAAMMIAMDDAVGAVLNKLRESGLEENTLVFFISDNGGPPGNTSENTPLRGHKASTWDGGVRVPFFVQWKGRLPAGKVYDHPVTQMDILPTALAAAGVEPRAEWKLDGVDLIAHFRGEKADPPHESVFWRFGRQMAIRTGDWKLVKARVGTAGGAAPAAQVAPPQLFNLKDDVGEQNDLSANEPERVKAMLAAWDKWNSGLQPPAWRPPDRARQRQQRRNAAPAE